MCGLFGLIRNTRSAPVPATDLFFTLGCLAEERGTDAAGIAIATDRPTRELRTAPTVSRRDVTAGGWRVVKGTGAFHQVWSPDLLDAVDAAPALLGHTRWATQGDVRRLANTSPLQVGQLIGTHNGDIDTARLRRAYTLPKTVGHTDTEVLFQALDQAGGVIADTVQVLETVVGRAALVWTDRRWPQMLMLARTAVSPLAIGRDTEDNLYWASNPGWFGRCGEHVGVDIPQDRIWLMPEGTLLLVDFSGPKPQMAGQHRFTATARTRDDRLAPVVAYRGFSDADRFSDEQVTGHRTVSNGTGRRSASAALPTLY